LYNPKQNGPKNGIDNYGLRADPALCLSQTLPDPDFSGEAMTTNIYSTSVRFGEVKLAEIDALLKRSGLNRAEFIRRAVDAYIAQLKNPTVDLYRMATTSEFNQIVLDVLIKHFRPETYDQVLEHLIKRMEQYHAHL
jgi:predicted DNA-binding protein